MKGLDKYLEPEEEIFFEEIQELVIKWGKDKGLLSTDNGHKQLLKCVSELGELCDAEIKNDTPEIIDGLGDVLVTLILYAEINNLDLTECLWSAYSVIKNRKGKTVNGTFIKES